MGLTHLLRLAKEEEATLNKPKAIPFSLSALSNEQKSELLSGFEKLTGQSGWKWSGNKKAAWIELSDEGTAEKIFKKLKALDIGKVEKGQPADKRCICVMKCESINFSKLAQEAAKVQQQSSEPKVLTGSN